MTKVPSWIQAILVLIAATIVLFAVGESAQESEWIKYLAYGLYTLVIILGCFLIIIRKPKSIWYVPFICNATSIIAAIIEPNFWRTSMWIPNVVGWVLTIIVTYIAWGMGKKRISKTGL